MKAWGNIVQHRLKLRVLLYDQFNKMIWLACEHLQRSRRQEIRLFRACNKKPNNDDRTQAALTFLSLIEKVLFSWREKDKEQTWFSVDSAKTACSKMSGRQEILHIQFQGFPHQPRPRRGWSSAQYTDWNPFRGSYVSQGMSFSQFNA